METFEECNNGHDKCVSNEEIEVGNDNIVGCYVHVVQCSNEMEMGNDNIDDDFSNREKMWSQLEKTLMYNDLLSDVHNISDPHKVQTNSENSSAAHNEEHD
ncbi:hypothetical protein Fot_38462 [Forsythia ovata]|uniref:Uncharacterized protein n=1 Tax=Forsythia ovata TaxID=205694 RepID=A0ABD1S1V8_9LAMI